MKNRTFQMKNKKYKTLDVIRRVKDNLKKVDTQKLNKTVNEEYKKRSKRALEQNPHWKMYEPSKERFLKSLKITKKEIKKKKQGEIIQQEFNKVIKRRVKAERTITNGPNLKNISDETLMKNLKIIRGVRKHEVGMKYQKRKRS